MARKLDTYRKKRDFTRTAEPEGGGRRTGKKQPMFVIQQHDARAMHYDLRLEVDGVLASWAVPKGPSTDPRQKRLAVQVEDHPLDYGDFEGRIGEGQYGGGAVIVWDTGSYENLTEKKGEPVGMAEAIENGHAKFALDGKKLRGAYALTRTRDGKKPQWILVKMNDADADRRRNPVSTQPESVLSGRTVKDVAAEEG